MEKMNPFPFPRLPSDIQQLFPSFMPLESRLNFSMTNSTFNKMIITSGYSFYCVEWYVKPGGRRRYSMLITNNIEDVKDHLRKDLMNDGGMALEGESIVVRVFYNGEVVQSVDMHPFIQYKFNEDEDVIYFKRNDGVTSDDPFDEDFLVDG
eukprot:TRINITY_DN9800_c0_g1_i1.p1 TRINITY_DN9800_c0_g1~~TRINITY_DN9800_c0_g1_i1.p1  ORF type:complete len:151 (-),score=36.97 TRINITY_DN9800_c0_g1_i1:249-701(-)